MQVFKDFFETHSQGGGGSSVFAGVFSTALLKAFLTDAIMIGLVTNPSIPNVKKH